MIRSSRARPVALACLVVSGVLLSGGVGCSKRVVEEGASSRHPFPIWVSELEAGVSRAGEVRERFGLPQETEASPRGGLVWHYTMPEFHWPPGDPDNPAVSANGRVTSRGALSLAEIGRWFGRLGRAFGDRVVYPPAQPRPTRLRHLPARIHELELEFEPDGTLRRLRYAPREGRAPVPPSV